MGHVRNYHKLSTLLWDASRDILHILFTKYPSLIEKKLVDEIPRPTRTPVKRYGLVAKFNDEVVRELCELATVTRAANYLVISCGFRHDSKSREDIDAHLQIYTHDVALLFTNDLLECIESPPITKAVFNHVFRARYRTKPQQFCIMPLYNLRPAFAEFTIAPSLYIRQPNALDRHILYCNPSTKSPAVETLLSYTRDTSKAIETPFVPELDALEFCMHLFVHVDFCSISTYQYRTSGLLPKGHSCTVSHHATPFEGGTTYFLRQSDLLDLKRNFKKIKNLFIKSDFKAACARFNESFRRGTRGCVRNDEDRLIDLCLAYEGLFSDEDDHTGISYKLAQRAAVTLSSRRIDERINEYRALKSSYQTRNKLMHRGKADRKDVAKAIQIFERALRRGFLFCVRHSLFKHNEWLKHSMS